MNTFRYRRDSLPGGLYTGNSEDFISQRILINMNKK